MVSSVCMQQRCRPLYSAQSDVKRTATCVSSRVRMWRHEGGGTTSSQTFKTVGLVSYFCRDCLISLGTVVSGSVFGCPLYLVAPPADIFIFPAAHYNVSLRRGSEAFRLLGLRVRIPPGARMSACCVPLFSGRDLCVGQTLVLGSPTECGVSLIRDLETSTRTSRLIRARGMRGDLQR
jgi:hypothetical protein